MEGKQIRLEEKKQKEKKEKKFKSESASLPGNLGK